MTLTVLQSVYNKDNPKYLSDSLYSLSLQTKLADKIIIVKDGDLTAELDIVLKEWERKLPVQIVGYKKNQGLAHALNFGLQYVDTDLVVRMDSDDIALPERFETEIEYLTNNPEVQIVGSSINEFYLTPTQKIERIRTYPCRSNKESKSLFKGTPIAHPTVMMYTKLLKTYRYNENTSMNEDIDLWFRLLRNDIEICTIQTPLLNFRITDGTFKRRSIHKAFNEFKIYSSNCVALFGYNYLLIYPITRLILRFLPFAISKKLYFSKSRTYIMKNENK